MDLCHVDDCAFVEGKESVPLRICRVMGTVMLGVLLHACALVGIVCSRIVEALLRSKM